MDNPNERTLKMITYHSDGLKLKLFSIYFTLPSTGLVWASKLVPYLYVNNIHQNRQKYLQKPVSWFYPITMKFP